MRRTRHRRAAKYKTDKEIIMPMCTRRADRHAKLPGLAAVIVAAALSASALGQVPAPTVKPGLIVQPRPILTPTPVPVPVAPPQPPPLHGWVDLHAHPMTNIAFGGKLIHGALDIGSILPSDPSCNHTDWSSPAKYLRATSEAQALGDHSSTHGGPGPDNLCGDISRKLAVGTLEQTLGADAMPDHAFGYPTFADWPRWNDVTHQRMWVEWIRRAYQGGLRVMVALATNSFTLGQLASGSGDAPHDDQWATDLQISELKGFVGRHSDFMEIALNSADVYRIVSTNKLAIVLGVEVDHIGDFPGYASPQRPQAPNYVPPNPPADSAVVAEIDRLYGEGVRYIFPIHILDNAFGGTAYSGGGDDVFNMANARENGATFNLVCSPRFGDPNDTIDVIAQDPGTLPLTILQFFKTGFAVTGVAPYPQCPTGTGHINALGLFPSGVTAIKEMMRLGMLIDIDHMSYLAVAQTLQLADQFGYPVNSGHNQPRFSNTTKSERNFTQGVYMNIGMLHGMAGVGSAGIDSYNWLYNYVQVITWMGQGRAFMTGPGLGVGGGNFNVPYGSKDNGVVGGFGTDMNGLQPSMPPRPGAGGGVMNVQTPACSACYAQKQVNSCLQKCPSMPATGNKNSVASAVAACRFNCTALCASACPNNFVTLPPAFVYGPSFPAPTDPGGKVWNYFTDGVAQYGMLWDFLMDVGSLTATVNAQITSVKGANVLNNNFNFGADYFFHTWQIAEAQSKSVH
jgi:hypothetical protein